MWWEDEQFCFVFKVLKLTSQMSDNSLILSRSTVREFYAVFILSTRIYLEVSSANRRRLLAISYNKDKKRPRTDPWGTPEL